MCNTVNRPGSRCNIIAKLNAAPHLQRPHPTRRHARSRLKFTACSPTVMHAALNNERLFAMASGDDAWPQGVIKGQLHYPSTWAIKTLIGNGNRTNVVLRLCSLQVT